jgi:hypothetical protein
VRDGFISAFMMSNIGGGEEAREDEEGAPSVNSATQGASGGKWRALREDANGPRQ